MIFVARHGGVVDEDVVDVDAGRVGDTLGDFVSLLVVVDLFRLALDFRITSLADVEDDGAVDAELDDLLDGLLRELARVLVLVLYVTSHHARTPMD